MAAEIAVLFATVIVLIFLFYISAAFRIFTYSILGLIMLAVLFKLFIKKYDENERGIIFRMGRYNRIGGPGWSIMIPFIEKEFAKIDVRTKMLSLVVNDAFTKDDLKLGLTGYIYYQIMDPTKAVLQIEDYTFGMKNIINSEIRNIINSMYMREVFGKLDNLNNILFEKIRHKVWQWGIDVSMFQIQNIIPPEEIVSAMTEKSVSKELMQAQVFSSEARKTALEAIGNVADSLDDKALSYLYLKALEKINESSQAKIVLPEKIDNSGKDVEDISGMKLSDIIDAVSKKIIKA